MPRSLFISREGVERITGEGGVLRKNANLITGSGSAEGVFTGRGQGEEENLVV